MSTLKGTSAFSFGHSFRVFNFTPLCIQLCLHPGSFKVCHRMTPSENKSISLQISRGKTKKKEERKRERGRKPSCQPHKNQGNVTVFGPPDTVMYGQIQLQKEAQAISNLKALTGCRRPRAFLQARPEAAGPVWLPLALCILLKLGFLCVFILLSVHSAVHPRGLLW